VLRLHLSIAACLTAVVAVAPRLLFHPNAPRRLHVLADPVLGGWVRWDGWWYLMIARHGYTYRPHHMSSVAFFPVYPLAIRAVSAVLPGGNGFSAVLLTVVSGAVALVLFHRWCRRRLSASRSRAALVVLALYPFAWYLYGAAYSDALYLALVLTAFLLLEQDHYLLAGLVGAVATAARPTGITLVIGLLAVALDRRRRASNHGRAGGWPRELLVLSSCAGLAAWCAWLAVRFGNPLAFIETEGAPGWNQPPGLHTWLKLGIWHQLLHLPSPEAIAILLQAALVVAFVCLVPAVARRFGHGYAVYTLAVVLVPAVSSADFLGLGRYLLPAFPVFAVVGAAIDGQVVWRRLTAIVSTTLLVAGTALFASGYLVA
jgi:hypothetical protein